MFSIQSKNFNFDSFFEQLKKELTISLEKYFAELEAKYLEENPVSYSFEISDDFLSIFPSVVTKSYLNESSVNQFDKEFYLKYKVEDFPYYLDGINNFRNSTLFLEPLSEQEEYENCELFSKIHKNFLTIFAEALTDLKSNGIIRSDVFLKLICKEEKEFCFRINRELNSMEQIEYQASDYSQFFEKLKSELIPIVAENIKSIKELIKDDPLIAYSLSSDDSLMCISPSALTKSFLNTQSQEQGEELLPCCFYSMEWPLYNEGVDTFDSIAETLEEIMDEIDEDDEEEFLEVREKVLNLYASVLKELQNQNIIDKSTFLSVELWDAEEDDEEMCEKISRSINEEEICLKFYGE